MKVLTEGVIVVQDGNVYTLGFSIDGEGTPKSGNEILRDLTIERLEDAVSSIKRERQERTFIQRCLQMFT